MLCSELLQQFEDWDEP